MASREASLGEGLVERADGQPDERELEVRRRLALALVDESEYGRAWPHLEVVFAHGGDSWWLHLATAQVCLLWSMDYDCVQAHAERTLELRPNNARAHLYLAQVAQDRGDDDRAAAHYLAGLERRPDEIDMSMQLAALWASQGADDEAIAVLENALIFDRTNARLLLRLAALVEDRDETRAERLYQRALEYNDNPLGAARHLIRFYQRQGRSRDAERVRTWVEDQSARREMRPLR